MRHNVRGGVAFVVALLCLGGGSRGRGQEADSNPMAPFDREVEAFMRARDVPGGALAVVKDRKLIYARGYGLADREKGEAVKPESLFRIASVTKPFTAVAVLQLVEQGKLRLEDRAFDLLRLQPVLLRGTEPDPRLARITIQELLNHAGGWDRDKSFDPMFRPGTIARATRSRPPAGPEAIIRYMLGQPLDFDPGKQYAYSNFGYCVLGRIIEKVSGESYGEYVQRHVLAPAGIRRMRLGKTREAERAPGEVRYYAPADGMVESVFPAGGKVPEAYGGFYLEAMEAHGGWIASAVDLARFCAALDDPEHSPLLKPETIRTMYALPPAPLWRKPDGTEQDLHYGCGWLVRPVGNGKANYWHNGSLPGTSTLLVRRSDGLSWVVLFNQRSSDPKLPDDAIDPALHRAAAGVRSWPSKDLFPQYP